MSAATPLPRDISEDSFGDTFEQAAHIYGWKLKHDGRARTNKGWRTPVRADGKGWPDYFCVRPSTSDKFACEIKTRYNKPTPEQEAWLAMLYDCGIDVYLWWPPDWPLMVERLEGHPVQLWTPKDQA